jgi:hypothetical protein
MTIVDEVDCPGWLIQAVVGYPAQQNPFITNKKWKMDMSQSWI